MDAWQPGPRSTRESFFPFFGSTLLISVSGGGDTGQEERVLLTLQDRSYNFRPECERRVLRRLGFFVGAFTLDAAKSVAAEEGARELEVIDAIHSLVAKSLISITTDEGQIFYRVLETTRAYIGENLTDSEEMEMVGKRYGLHFANVPGKKDADSLVTRKSEASPCTHIARAPTVRCNRL